MVLSTGMYTESRKMWRNKLSSKKIWGDLKKFFAEEYHDLRELQYINATQEGVHAANKSITMQIKITESLYNLAMATTSEKDVLTQLTSSIKHLA